VERRLRTLEAAPAGQREKLVVTLLRSLMRPNTQADEDLLAVAVWKLMRVYQRTEDDAILDGIRASGVDGGPATTVFGEASAFLQGGPALVRRHAKAAQIIRGEYALTMAELEQQCAQQERSHHNPRTLEVMAAHGDKPPVGLRLHAATDPASRVAVDGKDTGETTPISGFEGIVVGAGRHRVSFSAGGRTLDVDVDVQPGYNACVYRVLPP
jgi:hypothetical protein